MLLDFYDWTVFKSGFLWNLFHKNWFREWTVLKNGYLWELAQVK